MALYLYGLARASAPPKKISTPGVNGSSVRLEDCGSIVALVSDLPQWDYQARRKDLLAHSEVLQEALSSADVLPMRFGTLFVSSEELASEFLNPNEDALQRAFERLGGCVEMQVKGEYSEDEVAREILSGDRTIQKLQARAQQRGDVDSKIEIGRRFATLLDQIRYRDASRILDALGVLAVDAYAGDASGEYGVLNASFLVNREAVSRFEEAVASIQSYAGTRMTLRTVGPLPPYSFVDADSVAVG